MLNKNCRGLHTIEFCYVCQMFLLFKCNQTENIYIFCVIDEGTAIPQRAIK